MTDLEKFDPNLQETLVFFLEKTSSIKKINTAKMIKDFKTSIIDLLTLPKEGDSRQMEVEKLSFNIQAHNHQVFKQAEYFNLFLHPSKQAHQKSL